MRGFTRHRHRLTSPTRSKLRRCRLSCGGRTTDAATCCNEATSDRISPIFPGPIDYQLVHFNVIPRFTHRMAVGVSLGWQFSIQVPLISIEGELYTSSGLA